MLAILKKELRSFFGSFEGYTIIIGFLLLNGLWLWILKTDANILNSGFADLTQFFQSTAWLFLLLIPALTMKTFSEEIQNGTIEILKTKPISDWELVLGKFFSILIIIISILVPTLCYVYSIYQLANPIGNIEFGSLIGSYIGLIFLASTLVSIGIWFSTLFKNGLVALLSAITFSFFLFTGIQEFSYLVPNLNIENLGIIAHFSSISRGVIDSRDLFYFLLLSIFFLALSYYQINSKKRIKNIIYIGLVLVVTNIISSKFYTRFDLTEDKKYTLSDASISIIKTINEPVVFKIYLEGNFPAEFKRLQLETKQLLEELKAVNKNIKFLFINPEEKLQSLIKTGLIPSRLTVEENGVVSESVILPWATLQYKNKKETIGLLKDGDPKASQQEQLENSIKNLEYAFINGLKKISSKKEKSIAILSGNGELEDLKLYSLLKSLGENYHLAKFTLDSVVTNPIHTLEQINHYDLLFIAKPTIAFTEEEKFVLDQYTLNGGKSIWMLDNVTAEMDSLYTSGKTLAYSRNLNLDDFFFRYGARFNQNLVKDLYASKIALAAGNTGNQTNYKKFLWFYAPLISPTKEHPITTNIRPIKLVFPTTIDTLKNSIKKTVLLQSSLLSKAVQTPTIVDLNSVMEKPDPKTYNNGNKILGVLLEGNFISAYKDRIKPISIKAPKEIGVTTKMILISDGDIAKNQIHDGQPLELGVDKWTQEYHGNKEFLQNAVEYLLDDTGLISIRSKKIHLKTLNKKSIIENKTYWQLINLFIPIIFTLLAGVSFYYIRRKKYTI